MHPGGVLRSSEKARAFTTTDEAQKRCARGKEPDPEGYARAGSVYRAFWQRQTHGDKQHEWWLQGQRKDLLLKGSRGTGGNDGTVLHLSKLFKLVHLKLLHC